MTQPEKSDVIQMGEAIQMADAVLSSWFVTCARVEDLEGGLDYFLRMSEGTTGSESAGYRRAADRVSETLQRRRAER